MTDPIHISRPVFSQSPPLQHKVTFGGLHFGAKSKSQGDGAGDSGDQVDIQSKPRRKRGEKGGDPAGTKKAPAGKSGTEAADPAKASLAGTIFADDATPLAGDPLQDGPDKIDEQPPVKPPAAEDGDDGKASDAGKTPPVTGAEGPDEPKGTDKAPPVTEAADAEPASGEKKKRGFGFYAKSAIYTAAILGLTLLSIGVVPVATILGLKAGSGVVATIAIGVGAAFLRDSLQRKYGEKEGKDFDNYIKKEKVMGEISNWVRKMLKRIASIKVPIFGWSLMSAEKQEEWVDGRMETYHSKFEDRIRGLIDRFYDDSLDPEERKSGEEDLNKFSEWRSDKGVLYAIVAYAGLKARHIIVKQLPAQVLRLRNKGWYGFILAAALTFLAESVFKFKMDKVKEPEETTPPTNNSRMNPQFA